MKIICGPLGDQRTFTLELPTDTKMRIAMFVSGGIDSAILYYLLLQENKVIGNIHDIVPVMVERREGSIYFAKLVTAYIQTVYKLPLNDPIIVGNSELADDQQVKSGVLEAWDQGYDRVYVGIIDQLPQHMINWTNVHYPETDKFKTPLCNLNKSQVLDLVRQFRQTDLLYITHTCNVHPIGRCNHCNGCNERAWGFSQLDMQDPGIL